MFNPIVVCLDGSPYSEEILPYARKIASGPEARITLLRVVAQPEESEEARNYLERIAGGLGKNVDIKVAQGDVAESIGAEVGQGPDSLPAITTHGRRGPMEVVLGSVAQDMMRQLHRPVLLYKPRGDRGAAPKAATITNIVVSLDGSKLSESIIPSAIALAESVGAKITLLQVLEPRGRAPGPPSPTSADIAAPPMDTRIDSADVLESSYLHGHAHEIRSKHDLETEWEVLHGDPAEAIVSYVRGRNDVILAMSSHVRTGFERALFGSVTTACVRNAGVPILVCPPQS